jgi:hypothetical protein
MLNDSREFWAFDVFIKLKISHEKLQSTKSNCFNGDQSLGQVKLDSEK